MSLCPHGYTFGWDCPQCEPPPEMHLIVISQSSHDHLLARAAAQGKGMRSGRRLASGAYEIEVDDEVYRSLALIDPDPEKALQQLIGVGIGHS